MAKKAWKCPCGLEKDSEHFSRVPMTQKDVNEIKRIHAGNGWHSLGRWLWFCQPGHCSYCGANRYKCVVYPTNPEKTVYKCDACLHLGATVLPCESGYQGSWGHQVNMLKDQQLRITLQSPEPKSTRSSASSELTPEKRSRTDSYSITWKKN